MIAWNLLDTQDINVHNNIYIGGNQGINEEVILNVSGNPQWANIFGKVSKYVDSTNLVQDLNSDINISFDNEIYNNTNISYGVDFFRFFIMLDITILILVVYYQMTQLRH